VMAVSHAISMAEIMRRADPQKKCQNRDQLELGAQLQMQVQNDEQADACPCIENEVDTTTDPDKFSKASARREKPDEVEAPCRHQR
jgi:hypothetical protein